MVAFAMRFMSALPLVSSMPNTTDLRVLMQLLEKLKIFVRCVILRIPRSIPLVLEQTIDGTWLKVR